MAQSWQMDLAPRCARRGLGTPVDEFEEHRLTLGCPAHLAAGAKATATWLLEHIPLRTPPFDDTGPSWLAKAAATW
jgi:hypothetical protein